MKRPQLLVIVAEQMEHSAALLRATSLARRMDATVQLRSFEYFPGLQKASEHGFDLQAYLAGRQAKLDEFASRARKEGVEVDAKVVWGHPVGERILFEVLALRPDLVLKDVPHYRSTSHLFLNGLDWYLLGQCPAPLMLVQPNSPSLPLHMVAAVDPLDEHSKPHELNDQILRTATRLAEQCGAALEVVNAFQFIPVTDEYSGFSPEMAMYEEIREVHAERLYKLCKEHGVPPSGMHILDGGAADRIVQFAADRQADLVVMGSIHRTGLKHLFLGSTAEGVFDALPCDVLLIKPEGFAKELQEAMETGKAKAA